MIVLLVQTSEELKFGDKIDGGLIDAITKSRVLVVVFPKNYASSTWCLDELWQIVRYNETAKELYHVRALFYDVEPSVVRHCGGNYKKDLDKHEERGSQEVSNWKKALAKGAHLPGWDWNNIANELVPCAALHIHV
ncbi:Toll/interleukin-1 receptor (TIR) domain-containing protein [Heracleum sosnowskyi]|uniref:ADP-ribosyl cyclase/cyclic ADP-ribose hydrolase n=1 Tax=Heracleum sosnowskyi TaxID=360622 RepID=A0AAD8JAY8_9APIA|nr:Toll/interleukin-1 receptor (TIR) domain-containing protein [Heracleum sosnowskyi]